MPEIDQMDQQIKGHVYLLEKKKNQEEYMHIVRKIDGLTRDAAEIIAQVQNPHGWEVTTLQASFALSMNSIIEKAPRTLTESERAELVEIRQTIYNRIGNLQSRESDAARSANLS